MKRQDDTVILTAENSSSSVPAWLLENEHNGTLLVLIPEGEFLAGKPPFPVQLPAYYLALHPVTNTQYARFLNECRYTEADVARWTSLAVPSPRPGQGEGATKEN